jgi:hypothetical protein
VIRDSLLEAAVGAGLFENLPERCVASRGNARALLEMDDRGEAARGEHLVRDLERLLEADRPAPTVRADLQENLVGNVVVRGAEQLDEDLQRSGRCRKAAARS